MSDALESYTLPQITMTPNPDGRVLLEMAGGNLTNNISRAAARSVFQALSLAEPQWLRLDRKLEGLPEPRPGLWDHLRLRKP